MVDGTWSVVDLSATFQALSVSSNPENETAGPEQLQTNSIDRDWFEVIDGEDANEVDEEEDEIWPVQPLVHNSYREVLLRNATACQSPATSTVPTFVVKTEWRPTFKIIESSKRRIDRVYGFNQPPSAEDYQDDDPLSEYYESQDFAKGSVSLNRSMAVTRMRPAALEQKLKRIAAKTAVA
eukprot:gene36581-45117_t